MKHKKILSAVITVILVVSIVFSPVGMTTAKAGTGLIPTDNVRKFDLGSEDVGGTGVEGTSNWIKIVQTSNKMRLFEDVAQNLNVAALQVTFEISNWSGIEFPINWGCNITFVGDKSATWCGTDVFDGFSDYVINRNGEYTVTCNLAGVTELKGKEGISWLQTCEMVIGNLTEGDQTVIEIKQAEIYLPGETVPPDNAPISETVSVDTIVIDPAKVNKTNNGVFEGWGTSLCWYGNRIGGSEQASLQAAELLYNAQTGLGLNIIRYNIGGGDDPTHNHIERSDSAMPGYWTNYNKETGEFEYDFTLDANQRNVLLKSIEQCPDMLVEMFSNSAPYFMTRSGCTSGTTDSIKSNITTDMMPAFAEYLAKVVKYYVDLGINVVSVEPMNEPSNGWNVSHYGVKQEGCSIEKGEEQSAMITAMSAAMDKYGLSDIALAGCDETNDTTTNQAIKKLSEEALVLLDRINTHTYSRNDNSSNKLYYSSLELGKKLWMTETDSGSVKGTNAGEMGAALNFASQITDDLNTLRPSAWIMWQAIGSYSDADNEFDPDTLDQSTLDTNGYWGVCYADMNTETIVTTKKYYAFGQYTKYIRPGDNLIPTTDSYTTASYSEEDGQIKIVIYNTNATDREVSFDLSAFDAAGDVVNVIRTSGDYATGENWAKLADIKVVDGQVRATVKANSVTTFVVNGAKHDMATEIAKEDVPVDTDTPSDIDVELVDGRPTPAVESTIGRICFASGDWSHTVMDTDATTITGIDVSTMENGTYKITLPALKGEDGANLETNGATVFCIDLMEFAKHVTGIDIKSLTTDEEKEAYKTKISETVKARITSITLDGEELEFDASKVCVGDTEENGNFRIEVYNMYGPTAEDSAIDPDMVCFDDKMEITFELELAEIDGSQKIDIPTENDTENISEANLPENKPVKKIPYAVIGVAAGVVVAGAVTAVIIIRRKKNK